jgi:aspartate/methionine/tyrosine aminotransferase
MQSSSSNFHLSRLVEETLHGFSPIQTIMKMAEERNIIKMGLDPDRVISFGGGWCNHHAPETLRKIYQSLADDKTLFHQTGRYSSIMGEYPCREQLCALEQTVYHMGSLYPENILLGHSSTQLFHDLLRVLINPGESLSVLDPTYANYMNAIHCALPGSQLRFLPALAMESWTYLPDPEDTLETLKKYCSQGVRVLVIPVPDNPTSQIPSDGFLKAAREILEDHYGFLVLDHAYKALWFGRMPSCFSWSPLEYPNLVTLHSNSKWLSSLGRRFGWVEADEKIIKGLEKLNESVLLSPDTLHSRATAILLERTLKNGRLQAYIDKTRRLYETTASVMLAAIDDHLGWKRLQPDGGLYTCCPTPNDENSDVFVERVLKATGVLLIPGNGFGPSMNHAVRLSYGPLCYHHDLIWEGIERIGRYLNG